MSYPASVQIQQGDVCFDPVQKPECDLVVIKPKGERLVLVAGEHTGHNHEIIGDDLAGVALLESDSKKHFLDVKQPVEVVHPEHGTVTIPPGFYEVGKVFEYDYLKQIRREVQD